MTHYSPRQRQVIELIAGEGMSYAEVAAELGIAASTVSEHVDGIVERSGLLSGKHGSPRRRIVFRVYRELAAHG